VRHLLVITDGDADPPQIAVPQFSAEFKCLRKPDFASARSLIEAGVFDAAVFAADSVSAAACRMIADFRAIAPDCPLILVAGKPSPGGEHDAYQAGADAVIVAPADSAVVFAVAARLTDRREPAAAASKAAPTPAASPFEAAPALAVMRDFSEIFSYSLDYRQLSRQFALKLREIIGVARVALFLEVPPTGAPMAPASGTEASRLPCAAAVGLPADLVDCFELSRTEGIGRRVTQAGRIFRLGAESAAPFLQGDPRMQRECEILGCETALPISDRERTIGVALLSGRLTGVPFSDAELLLVCHLMEELGLAVKNSWLHQQLASSNQLFSEVLGAMTCGALVAGPDLGVLFANPTALRLLKGGDAPAGARIEFAGLPAPLAERFRQAASEGREVAPFDYSHAGPPARELHVSLVPLVTGGALPRPVLMLLEDFTQVRAAQRAEIEASNLRLIGLIAKRFAHEIRNSLVPLTTHQQLFDTDYGNAEFRDSLKQALRRETARIQRFTEQMIFLSQTEGAPTDLLPLEELLQRSFSRSREFLGCAGELEIRSDVPDPVVRGHRPSLGHALQEIFLNGLQSAAGPARITVSVSPEAAPGGRRGLALRVRDNGAGFATDIAGRAADPFFTTRNTGVGLGLTVAKRVIEAHAGRLEVQARRAPEDPDLIIHLPLSP